MPRPNPPDNPHSLSQALLAIGLTFRVRRSTERQWRLSGESLEIAQDSGNQFNESHIAVVLSQLEALHGAPEAAFDYLTLAIRNYLDTGNIGTSRSPLAILAALLDRLGHYEPAATVADFAANPRDPHGLSRDHHDDRAPARGARR